MGAGNGRLNRDCAALLMGTSSEYLGRRPLPNLLTERPFLLVLGLPGVGKTSVARRVLGSKATLLRGANLQEAAVAAVRRRRWPEDLQTAEALIIDGPTLLHRRPGVIRLLQALIKTRSEQGLRTAVCQGAGDDSVLLLVDGLEGNERVTLNLRFPSGRGRVRWTMRMCQELGVDRGLARQVQPDGPWTYLKVMRALKRIQKDHEGLELS